MNNDTGLLFAVVTDNMDPDALGRVQVSIDSLGETITTDWISVIQMGASPEAGSFFLPEIDSKVIISFLGTGFDNPIVMGSPWGAFQVPPESEENSASDLNADGENNLNFLRSRSGQRIILDDKDGEEKVQIISPDSATRFEFLTADEMINIETDKDITIKAGGKLSIEAEDAEMTFEGGLALEVAGGLLMETDSDIELTSGSGITAEGSSVKLN